MIEIVCHRYSKNYRKAINVYKHPKKGGVCFEGRKEGRKYKGIGRKG